MRQLELIRNIHFQSLKSVWRALPGNGLISLPSPLPMNPLAPRRRILPYWLMYRDFQSYFAVNVDGLSYSRVSWVCTWLSRDSLERFRLVRCTAQRSVQERWDRMRRTISSTSKLSNVGRDP